MATTAPAPPSVSGDNVTYSINVNNPVVVQRAIQTIANLRLISKLILRGRVNMTGSGSALFEGDPDKEMADAPKIIGDNDDYPLTNDDDATPSVVTSDKWALATEISDVLISRGRYDVIARKLTRLANGLALKFEATAMSAIGTAVTQTQAAVAVWTGTSGDPFRDVMRAAAKVDEQNRGWVVDTAVLKATMWAELVSTKAVLDTIPREQQNAVLRGSIVEFAGMRFLKGSTMPSGVDVFVADSTALGSVAFEDQGGGYSGSAEGVQTKVFRREGNDGVRIQARLVNVPVVENPNAACELTGVTS